MLSKINFGQHPFGQNPFGQHILKRGLKYVRTHTISLECKGQKLCKIENVYLLYVLYNAYNYVPNCFR